MLIDQDYDTNTITYIYVKDLNYGSLGQFIFWVLGFFIIEGIEYFCKQLKYSVKFKTYKNLTSNFLYFLKFC